MRGKKSGIKSYTQDTTSSPLARVAHRLMEARRVSEGRHWISLAYASGYQVNSLRDEFGGRCATQVTSVS